MFSTNCGNELKEGALLLALRNARHPDAPGRSNCRAGAHHAGRCRGSGTRRRQRPCCHRVGARRYRRCRRFFGRGAPVDYGEDNPEATDEIVVAPSAEEDPDEQLPHAYDQQAASAYGLYWEKCCEYLDTYGDPSWIRAEDGSYMMTGLCVAQLIDFDGDGTEELALVCNTLDDFVPNTISGYLDQQIYGFAVEIWAYRDDRIDLV